MYTDRPSLTIRKGDSSSVDLIENCCMQGFLNLEVEKKNTVGLHPSGQHFQDNVQYVV